MMMVERKQKLVIFGEPFMMDSGVDDKLSVSGEGWSEVGETPAASREMANDGEDAEALSPADINETRLWIQVNYHRNGFTYTVNKRSCELNALKRRKLRRLCITHNYKPKIDSI